MSSEREIESRQKAKSASARIPRIARPAMTMHARTGLVHLVHEDDSGQCELACLPPHSQGLRLHAGRGVQDRHRAVQHAHTALHRKQRIIRDGQRTSSVKSTCPGVSIRLMRCCRQKRVTAAAWIVIPANPGNHLETRFSPRPRSRSSSMKSVTVLPVSTSPITDVAPARYKTRSVAVVLPERCPACNRHTAHRHRYAR